MQARGLVHQLAGLTLIGSPIKLSDTPPRAPSAPAKFGEHTDAVLAELGLDAAGIEALRSEGAV